jgi:DNA-binding GntR family transcriptional regulator
VLQISRGTLREALRQLEQEGLVTAGARGRLSVRAINVTEIRDIYAVRAALESLAARILCELPGRDRAMKSLHLAVDAIDAARDAPVEERIETDSEFHRSLCRLTGNKTLLHSWTSLEGSIRMSVMFGGLERAATNMTAQRHRDIVTAIETGDTALSIRTIHEHMHEAANNLVA